MANLVRWIEEEAKGETIEGVVIGDVGWGGDDESWASRVVEEKRGVVLPWDEVKGLLDYEFNDSYGAPECHAIYAWSTTKVMWITQYDGSTCLSWAPRWPVDCKPEMPGG